MNCVINLYLRKVYKAIKVSINEACIYTNGMSYRISKVYYYKGCTSME